MLNKDATVRLHLTCNIYTFPTQYSTSIREERERGRKGERGIYKSEASGQNFNVYSPIQEPQILDACVFFVCLFVLVCFIFIA